MIQPIEYNVLIRQEKAAEKTAGGLYKPESVAERDKHGETRGEIVSVSPMAFAFDDWPAGADKPKAGDRIVFAKHAGTFVTDDDGAEYRMIKDRDVLAVLA